ncbi:MAG: hypothetical protein R8J41_06725 [Alphaproteobacteria bacterium]|uniref:hypothetical protein n=1 Tax=Pyruvatibacter sp. HU-CL02332 TaxID=3127650 RepID=UPI002969CFE9|nr:hypothetical protein [Alphaproteobacteria bacterium]
MPDSNEHDPQQQSGPQTGPHTDLVHDPVSSRREDRWALFWDVMVFQLKLGLDALRDLVLSPLSFGALLLGVIAGGDKPYQYFERLLRFGRQTERIINLFGTARVPYDPYEGTSDNLAVDRLFSNVEDMLRRNVDGSEKASSAKTKVDETIDELEARLEKLRAKAKQRFESGPTV